LIGHNFASDSSICKIQKGADKENSEIFWYVRDCKYFDLNSEWSTFNRGLTKDIITILKKFMKEHMFPLQHHELYLVLDRPSCLELIITVLDLSFVMKFGGHEVLMIVLLII
jgi:hypothetical protein